MLASLGHPCKFQRVSRLGSVTARHSSSGRQPNFAALNRGRHLYSAGRPSRWALAHILVNNNFHLEIRQDAMGVSACRLLSWYSGCWNVQSYAYIAGVSLPVVTLRQHLRQFTLNEAKSAFAMSSSICLILPYFVSYSHPNFSFWSSLTH